MVSHRRLFTEVYPTEGSPIGGNSIGGHLTGGYPTRAWPVGTASKVQYIDAVAAERTPEQIRFNISPQSGQAVSLWVFLRLN